MAELKPQLWVHYKPSEAGVNSIEEQKPTEPNASLVFSVHRLRAKTECRFESCSRYRVVMFYVRLYVFLLHVPKEKGKKADSREQTGNFLKHA